MNGTSQLILAVLFATQAVTFIVLMAHLRHSLDHLHDLLTILGPLRVEIPQIKSAYEQGYRAGILEQTRRYNEEMNSPKSPKPEGPKGESAA